MIILRKYRHSTGQWAKANLNSRRRFFGVRFIASRLKMLETGFWILRFRKGCGGTFSLLGLKQLDIRADTVDTAFMLLVREKTRPRPPLSLSCRERA